MRASMREGITNPTRPLPSAGTRDIKGVVAALVRRGVPGQVCRPMSPVLLRPKCRSDVEIQVALPHGDITGVITSGLAHRIGRVTNPGEVTPLVVIERG